MVIYSPIYSWNIVVASLSLFIYSHTYTYMALILFYSAMMNKFLLQTRLFLRENETKATSSAKCAIYIHLQKRYLMFHFWLCPSERQLLRL